MLGQDLEGLSFLDAFGGTGLMGFEAWSRGAQVTIVERNRAAAEVIEQHAAALGATVRVRRADVRGVIGALGAFDLAYLDPPYDTDPGPAVRALAPHVDRLVLERERGDLPEVEQPLVLERSRRFGRTVVAFYQRGPER